MWNRRENPLRPAGKGDKRSPQTWPVFLPGVPCGGRPRRRLPAAPRVAAPGARSQPRSSHGGEAGRQEAALPAPARPPKPPAESGAAARPQLAPLPRRREPQGPAATGAPLPLASPGRGTSGAGGCPGCVKIARGKRTQGAGFERYPTPLSFLAPPAPS